MFNFYELSIIPDILQNFKVKNVVVTNLSDEQIIEQVLNYDSSVTAFGSSNSKDINDNIYVIDGYPLDSLKDLKEFDAIFINDDPNWYTVYSELNLIKENNDEFPLVFICNNRFPHKFRDSYINPNVIPEEFRNRYVKELPICFNNERIVIYDGLFHADEENTPKNGVSTAINDFLSENQGIGMMDIRFTDEMVILYPKSTISTIRIDKIQSAIEGKQVNKLEFPDKLIEYQLLFSYINEFKSGQDNLISLEKFKSVISEKDDLITSYENQIRTHDSEIRYKESQIDSFESKLNLKDSEIKNIESILQNKDVQIKNLQNQITDVNSEMDTLKNDFDKKEKLSKSNNKKLKDQFKVKENDLKSQIVAKNSQISYINDQFLLVENELNEKNRLLDVLKDEYTYQSSKLDNKEYCISCFKEEISNNHSEIQYLKVNTFLKKILSPFSYVFLMLKSNPKEIPVNIKLYKALKDSKCFDIGYYLNNNEDVQKSKWCKYFSPELHYVCNGFNEHRKFNKKYFVNNSKKALLDYLLSCEEL